MDELGGKVITGVVIAILIYTLQSLGVPKMIAAMFGGASSPMLESALNSTQESENVFWTSIDKCGTDKCYKLYLNKYPQGKFASIANVKLNRSIAPDTHTYGGQPLLSTPSADECLVSQGQVVTPNGNPVQNARVTLLVPNISAFEHTSIRDGENVVAESRSQRDGLFNLNKNLETDFKYNILVEAEGYDYFEKEVDLTSGCPTQMIKIILR